MCCSIKAIITVKIWDRKARGIDREQLGLPRGLRTDRRELWATEARALGSLASAPPALSHTRILQPHMLPRLLPDTIPFSFLQGEGGGKGQGQCHEKRNSTLETQTRI